MFDCWADQFVPLMSSMVQSIHWNKSNLFNKWANPVIHHLDLLKEHNAPLQKNKKMTLILAVSLLLRLPRTLMTSLAFNVQSVWESPVLDGMAEVEKY